MAFRHELLSLDPTQRKLLDDYVTQNYGESYLAAVRGLSPTEWLAEGGGSNSDVLKFVDWHTARLERQRQSEAVRREISDVKQDHLRFQKKLFQDGYLSMYAQRRAASALEADVYIGDIWDTTLQHNAGYFPGEGFVVIAPSTVTEGTGDDSRLRAHIRRVLPHELNHLQFDAHGMPGWMLEAYTEHLTTVASGGGADTMKPSQRLSFDKNRTYDYYRELLGYLHSDGLTEVPVRVGTQAYSSYDRSSVESLLLRSDLSRAWASPDIITEVTELFTAIRKGYLETETKVGRYYPKYKYDRYAAGVVLNHLRLKARNQREGRHGRLGTFVVAETGELPIVR